MEENLTTIDRNLRQVRVVHGAMFVTVALYAYVVLTIPRQSSGPLDMTLFRAIVVVAAVVACAAIILRSRFLGPAFEKLRAQPDANDGLAQWRKGVVISDALAESVALFGVGMHSLGATNRQAIPFFVVSAVLMLLWWPRRP